MYIASVEIPEPRNRVVTWVLNRVWKITKKWPSLSLRGTSTTAHRCPFGTKRSGFTEGNQTHLNQCNPSMSHQLDAHDTSWQTAKRRLEKNKKHAALFSGSAQKPVPICPRLRRDMARLHGQLDLLCRGHRGQRTRQPWSRPSPSPIRPDSPTGILGVLQI